MGVTGWIGGGVIYFVALTWRVELVNPPNSEADAIRLPAPLTAAADPVAAFERICDELAISGICGR